MIKVFTIGFGGKTKDQFMEILDAVGIRALIDIRLWRVARFVPWAGGENLATAPGGRYIYVPEFAPTKELLTGYRDGTVDWAGYEKIFNELLTARRAEELFDASALDHICFLCSEKTADQCHRRLAAEYLAQHLANIRIVHL